MDELEDQLNIVNRYIRNAIQTGVIPIPEALVLDEAWRGIQCTLDELKLYQLKPYLNGDDSDVD